MSTLKIKFYGTRGSIPVSKSNFQEFGGNTTCIRFQRMSNGVISILDAGTGIRDLGKEFVTNYPDQKELLITFTHFHWDHIQGFPFFDPAYDPDMHIHIRILGKNQEHTNLREIFTMLMKDTYFPVPLHKMGANFSFLSIDEEQFRTSDALVQSIKQNHPGGSYGFRTIVDGKVIVICTDHEHGDTVQDDFVEFSKDADILIHEAQFTQEELKTRKGWGHSSYDQAMEVAERAGAKQLIMTHHDPDHDDDFLRKIEKRCQDRFPNCELAREGVEYVL